MNSYQKRSHTLFTQYYTTQSIGTHNIDLNIKKLLKNDDLSLTHYTASIEDIIMVYTTDNLPSMYH